MEINSVEDIGRLKEILSERVEVTVEVPGPEVRVGDIGWSTTLCNVTKGSGPHSGYVCTLPSDHTGDHAALGCMDTENDNKLLRWSQD